MNQISTVGAARYRRDTFYSRYRKAQRFLDDHGMPLPDARLRVV